MAWRKESVLYRVTIIGSSDPAGLSVAAEAAAPVGAIVAAASAVMTVAAATSAVNADVAAMPSV